MIINDSMFIAIDLETSGKYPLDAEICEFAGVRAQRGRAIERFHTLIKPKRPMSREVISIHNITNEMVENSPAIEDVINTISSFLADGYVVAHHAPFDMGFLAPVIEKAQLALPSRPAFCTSLLAQARVKSVPNFRLKTLVSHYKIEHLKAHRALDDAEACLEVFFRIVGELGGLSQIEELQAAQGLALEWKDFSLEELKKRKVLARIISAIQNQASIEFVYEGGSRPGEWRRASPIGIVRNPKGDFFVAQSEDLDEPPKRFFLNKIRDC